MGSFVSDGPKRFGSSAAEQKNGLDIDTSLLMLLSLPLTSVAWILGVRPPPPLQSSEIVPRQRRDRPIGWHQRATIVPALPSNLPMPHPTALMASHGGESVSPRENEEFLYRHPKIQDVQVIGVPDRRYGEELCASVRLRDDEIRAFCKGQIAHYKIPRYVKFVDGFPTTATGKIQKFTMPEKMIAELGLRLKRPVFGRKWDQQYWHVKFFGFSRRISHPRSR